MGLPNHTKEVNYWNSFFHDLQGRSSHPSTDKHVKHEGCLFLSIQQWHLNIQEFRLPRREMRHGVCSAYWLPAKVSPGVQQECKTQRVHGGKPCFAKCNGKYEGLECEKALPKLGGALSSNSCGWNRSLLSGGYGRKILTSTMKRVHSKGVSPLCVI